MIGVTDSDDPDTSDDLDIGVQGQVIGTGPDGTTYVVSAVQVRSTYALRMGRVSDFVSLLLLPTIDAHWYVLLLLFYFLNLTLALSPLKMKLIAVLSPRRLRPVCMPIQR